MERKNKNIFSKILLKKLKNITNKNEIYEKLYHLNKENMENILASKNSKIFLLKSIELYLL